MPSRDFVRFVPNERVDLPDFTAMQRNNRSESRLGFQNLLFAGDTTDARVKKILKGFLVTDNASAIIDIANGAATSFEILPDGSEDKGLLWAADPASQSLDFTGQPANTYDIWIRFVQDLGNTGVRVFWNDNTTLEDADSIETRLVTTWDVQYATASPGAEWISIASVVWGGATVIAGNITMERDMFFEGDEAATFAQVWGDGVNDRSTDRAANGVHDMYTFVHAVRRQIEDTLGGGQKWYEVPTIGINDHVATVTDPHGTTLNQQLLFVYDAMTLEDGLGGTDFGFWDVDEFIATSGELLMGIGHGVSGVGTSIIKLRGSAGQIDMRALTLPVFITTAGIDLDIDVDASGGVYINGAGTVDAGVYGVEIRADEQILISGSSGVRIESDVLQNVTIDASTGNMLGTADIWRSNAVSSFEALIGGVDRFIMDGTVTRLKIKNPEWEAVDDAAWLALTPTPSAAAGAGNAFFLLTNEAIGNAIPAIIQSMSGRSLAGWIDADDIEASNATVANYYFACSAASVTAVTSYVPLTAFNVPDGAFLDEVEVNGNAAGTDATIVLTVRRIALVSGTMTSLGTSTVVAAAGAMNPVVAAIAEVIDYSAYSYEVEIESRNDGSVANSAQVRDCSVTFGMPALIPAISSTITP